jgi:hypothetical protein
MSFRAGILLLTLAAMTGGRAVADEPIPAPRIVPAEPVVLIPYRVSQYEVWQHMAVDRQGFFRPRIVLTPHGAFYSYNGQPAPWVMSEPRRFMPYVSD